VKISVCNITLNEAETLRRCLESCVLLADEIGVLDSGSTDGLEGIAGTRITPWYFPQLYVCFRLAGSRTPTQYL